MYIEPLFEAGNCRLASLTRLLRDDTVASDSASVNNSRLFDGK